MGLFTGDDSSEAKQQAIKNFKDGKVQVLLCSNAGKAGLDLPNANYTIHLDVPFSHGIADQRSTRTRRVSSKYKSIVVIYIVVKDSIEEYYYHVMKARGDLASAVMDNGQDKVVVRPSSLKAFLDEH